MKVCNRCNIERPFGEFNIQKNSKDGYRTICKICRKKYNEENKEKIKETLKLYKERNKEEIKIKEKKYREENKDKRLKYREENKEKIKQQTKEYYENNKDIILDRCKSYRDNNKEKIDSYLLENKEKRKEVQKKYREENKDKLGKQKKEYYLNNKDSIKNYRIENKEKIASIKKEKIKNDPIFALSTKIRVSLSNSFKRFGFSKNSKSEEILGCSFYELKIYIESKFQDWMTWENRGLYNGELNYGWDIDHIIPISLALTEEDVIRLNHYTNLQPLCSYINRYIKRDNL
jgi:hypothetical protein